MDRAPSPPSRGRRAPRRSAIGVLLVALSLSPAAAAAPAGGKVDKLIDRAQTSLDRHRYDRAAKLFARADEEAGGRSLKAVVGLTRSSLLLLEFDDAIEAAERWIRMAATPDGRATGYQFLGIALFRRGLTERWGPAWKPGRKPPDTGESKARLELADASMRAGVDALRRAVEEVGSAAELHYASLHLADVLSWLDEDEEALAILDAYDAAGGTDPYADDIRCSTKFNDSRQREEAEEADDDEPAPVEPGGEVKAPVKLHAPAPRYPPGARAARMEATIVVQAIIDEEGTVECVRPIVGNPYPLAHATMEAVKQWRFEPARREGEPVGVFYNLSINFDLRSAGTPPGSMRW